MVRIASLLAGICVIVIGFLVGPSVATFSGKNGLITFARFDGKHVEIFSANPDGSDIRKLRASRATPCRSSRTGPERSADRVRQRQERHRRARGRPDLSDDRRRRQCDATHPRPRVPRQPGMVPCRYEHGDRTDSAARLVEGDLDHPGVRSRRRHGRRGAARHSTYPTADFDSEPQFSPDGTTIVFTRFKSARRSAIFRVNVDGSGLKRLTRYKLSPIRTFRRTDAGSRSTPGLRQAWEQGQHLRDASRGRQEEGAHRQSPLSRGRSL